METTSTSTMEELLVGLPTDSEEDFYRKCNTFNNLYNI